MHMCRCVCTDGGLLAQMEMHDARRHNGIRVQSQQSGRSESYSMQWSVITTLCLLLVTCLKGYQRYLLWRWRGESGRTQSERA